MPIGRAFGAGAVVAADVDDQRVVELAHVLDRLDHAADLVVGIGDVGGEDLGLAGEQLLLVGVERVPLRQVVRPRRELRVRRDDAEPLLVGEDLLAQAFQPMSNLPLNFSIHSCVGWCGAWVPPGT